MQAKERCRKVPELPEPSGLSAVNSDDTGSEKTCSTPPEGMPVIPGENQQLEKLINPSCTESDIRSIINLFELLEGWDRSANERTSNPSN